MSAMKLSQARQLLAPLHVEAVHTSSAYTPLDPSLYGPDPYAEMFVAKGRNGVRWFTAEFLRHVDPCIFPVIVEECDGERKSPNVQWPERCGDQV